MNASTSPDLHAQIMNLPCISTYNSTAQGRAYIHGHHDARHAAAELVSAHLDAAPVHSEAVSGRAAVMLTEEEHFTIAANALGYGVLHADDAQLTSNIIEAAERAFAAKNGLTLKEQTK